MNHGLHLTAVETSHLYLADECDVHTDSHTARERAMHRENYLCCSCLPFVCVHEEDQ